MITAKTFRELSFEKMAALYIESNQKKGRQLFGWETAERQLALAEEDLYYYLLDVFFCTDGARCFFLERNGRYVSGLRTEPYEKGLLLEALETTPEYRRMGYAEELIQSVLAVLEAEGVSVLYSHVNRANTASLAVHRKCGFEQALDYAVFIDGSVDSRSVTLFYDFQKSRKKMLTNIG